MKQVAERTLVWAVQTLGGFSHPAIKQVVATLALALGAPAAPTGLEHISTAVTARASVCFTFMVSSRVGLSSCMGGETCRASAWAQAVVNEHHPITHTRGRRLKRLLG
jgi:hypothetical protein